VASLPVIEQEFRATADTEQIEQVADIIARHMGAIRDELRTLRQPGPNWRDDPDSLFLSPPQSIAEIQGEIRKLGCDQWIIPATTPAVCVPTAVPVPAMLTYRIDPDGTVHAPDGYEPVIEADYLLGARRSTP
jgi:hypothetical protein